MKRRVREAAAHGLLAHDVDRARQRVAAVEEGRRPLQHLDLADVVEGMERGLRLGDAVGEDQAARERIEAADGEEVEDAEAGAHGHAAGVAQGVAEDEAGLVAHEAARDDGDRHRQVLDGDGQARGRAARGRQRGKLGLDVHGFLAAGRIRRRARIGGWFL